MDGRMLKSIDRVTERIDAITGGRIHSAWLYGSVVLDDFQLGWSDIDFLVLTNAPLPESSARELMTLRQTMSAEEPGNAYYRLFEGVIADLDEYRKRKFSRLVYWGTSGQRVADSYEPDTFSRYELAKRGLCVYGQTETRQAVRGIFTVPGREEMTAAVWGHYEAIRRYAVRTDESLYSCGWLLDIARCIYTLRHYDVIAKTKAGIWALEEGIFPDDTPLRRAVETRLHPLLYRDREDSRLWRSGLGPVVQQYADVLEKELSASGKGFIPETG